jgi:GNAT superfamily N-acetyltransferase
MLELHCLGNYQGDQPWFRGDDFRDYYEKWLSTPQPAEFLAALKAGVEEGRVIAEVCEEDSHGVGYLSVSFLNVEGYDLLVAEISDIGVLPAHQRRGIGTLMLEHAESQALKRGAQLLRADIGTPNDASRVLHEKAGFEPVRLLYEKRLF